MSESKHESETETNKPALAQNQTPEKPVTEPSIVRESPQDWNLGIDFTAMQWPEGWGRLSC